MKKLALILLSVFVFTGCVSENPTSDEKMSGYSSLQSYSSSSPEIPSQSEPPADHDLSLEPFTFGTTINVFREKGGVSPCAHRFDVPEDEFLSLEVWMSVSPDKSMPRENIPLRVYAVGDGAPVDFSVESNFYNGELGKMHELYVGSDEDIICNIKIPRGEIKDVTVLSIVYNCFPEYIPKKGLGRFSGVGAYTMANSAKTTESFRQNTARDSDYYITDYENTYSDIGTIPLSELPDGDSENHFYNDVEITSENQPLYIKFNSGGKANYSYDILLFRDGELLRAFGGEYSLRVNCDSGKRTLQYCIPPELLGEDGLHTFCFAAIPAFLPQEVSFTMGTQTTAKIRVLVNKEV